MQVSAYVRDVKMPFAAAVEGSPRTPLPQTSYNLFSCLSPTSSFVMQQLAPWKRLKGAACEENHCSFYVRPKSYFSYNLLEPSWHFPPPPKQKEEEGGAWAYGVGGKGKAQTYPSLLCSLLQAQRAEKTIHLQRRGMNTFPNEEMARRSKKEEMPHADTLPA